MSASHEVEYVAIAEATRLLEYTGPLTRRDTDAALDSARAAQWVRQWVACHITEDVANPEQSITPNTLIPVIYWSTVSTYQSGTEHIDLVPLWMLAPGVDAFLRAHMSTPSDPPDPATTLLGSERAPYHWHLKIFWGDEHSVQALSEESRKHLEEVVPPDVLNALAGFNDEVLRAIKQGMPSSYKGFDSLDVDMGCGQLEQQVMAPVARYRRFVPGARLRPMTLLPDGTPFQPHKFAEQWLSERGLAGDAQVPVTYQEVETIDSTAQRHTASVPLRSAVTQGFLIACQSKEMARDLWVYPHISQMAVDFSSLQVNGQALPQDLLSQLQAGIAPGYQGTGAPIITERDAQGNLLSGQEKGQLRQLELLDDNQAKLARLFAGVPTFDTVFKNLLISAIKDKMAVHLFRPSLLPAIDPDNWYVNRFATDANGQRSIIYSRSFTHELWECLDRDAAPIFSIDAVGFFTRPDTLEEVDSVFASPVDMRVLRAMESVFYIAHPTTNDAIKRQFRDDFLAFRTGRNWADSFDTLTPPTAKTALADLLARRFLHLLDLYRFDLKPQHQLTPSERIQRSEQDRLLDIITTHPSKADRDRILRAPIPHVYEVMLDMGETGPQKWPAAMVIKRTDEPSLVLYSLEGGIQRFRSFQALVNKASPVHGGQKRTIQSVSTEQPRHVFEMQADELLQMQHAALERALNAPQNETLTLEDFAKKAEGAFVLPMLSLDGPLGVRNTALAEKNRPNLYKTATGTQKETYRRLEQEVVQIASKMGRRSLVTLVQFTREKITHYLQQNVHSGIEPDPDKTQVTLFHGDSANPRQSRTTSLTQLMLDNVRPEQYPNAMREVLPVHLVDKEGERIRNPANGYFFTLTGGELAAMATRIDAGGNYEVLLREEMNKPDYKTDWQAAYVANMKFKGYEAALRGDEVFKAVVIDNAFDPPVSKKQVALWLDAVLKSPQEQARAPVMGRRVHLYGLVLGGSAGAGGQHGTLGNAVSIDGALIFSDQDGPDIKGTVGVYLPDSPDGNDFHEFADLGDGIAQLLQQEAWQAYFRSRISTLDPDEIKRTLGQQQGRPLIRGLKITGDYLEVLHRAHVSFHSAYADHRSNSNLDVRRQLYSKVVQVTIEALIDLASMLLVPGYQMLKPALRTGWFLFETGIVPRNLQTLVFVHKVVNNASRVLARTVVVPSRGQSTFLALTARQSQAEAVAGLPLEKAVYSRYAVQDTSVLQGMTADAQGFYRVIVKDPATGKVIARPVYVRQPNGTVLQVHDQTRLKATEATLVDPATGLSIRSSGVTRSTVARMPNGEWRGVGFGRGGGKRPAASIPEPGPSKVRVISTSIRTPRSWDHQIMDLAPSLMTRLPGWPQSRSLLIIDQGGVDMGWSVRFTPGQAAVTYPRMGHPGRSDSDIVLRRTHQDHYSLMLSDRTVVIPADGDCFFNAVARGLNEGWEQGPFSIQGLRNAAADYIEAHPELSDFQVRHATAQQQALFESAPSRPTGLEDWNSPSWKNWGKTQKELADWDRVFPAFSAKRMEQSIEIDHKFYEIIPYQFEGRGTEALIRRPETFIERQNQFEQLEAVIQESPHIQPRFAELINNQWEVHAPLFEKPITDLVGDIFPGLTEASRFNLAKRLYQLADPNIPFLGLTPSRVQNINKVLDAWRSEPAEPHAGEINGPLALLERNDKRVSDREFAVRGVQSKGEFFDRIDFALQPTERVGLQVGVDINRWRNEIIKSNLQRMGYQIAIQREVLGEDEMIFRHIASSALYYMQLRMIRDPVVVVERGLKDSVNQLIAQFPETRHAIELKKTMDEGQLGLLLGGIQYVGPAEEPIGFIFRP